MKMNILFKQPATLLFCSTMLMAVFPAMAERALIAGEGLTASLSSNIDQSIERAGTILWGRFKVVDSFPKEEKYGVFPFDMSFEVDSVLKGDFRGKKVSMTFFSDLHANFDCKDQTAREKALEVQEGRIKHEEQHYAMKDYRSKAYTDALIDSENRLIMSAFDDFKAGQKYVLSALIKVPFGSFDEWYRLNNMMIVEGEYYVLFLHEDIEQENGVNDFINLNKNEWYPGDYLQQIESKIGAY